MAVLIAKTEMGFGRETRAEGFFGEDKANQFLGEDLVRLQQLGCIF